MIAEMIPESSSRVVLVTGSRSWTDAESMRETFSDAWRGWGPKNATRPVLLSGPSPKGADAMAELMWRDAGSEIIIFPADWSAHREQPAWRWPPPPRSSARPGLRCCARPSSTSAGSPEARKPEAKPGAAHAGCIGALLTRHHPLQGSSASCGDQDDQRDPGLKTREGPCSVLQGPSGANERSQPGGEHQAQR